MTFDDLQHCIHEDIIIPNEDPALIAAEVSKLLNGLKREDIFVVHRLAKDFASAIAFELAYKDGDMAEVIRTQGAVLGVADNLAPAPPCQQPYTAPGHADED